ncbi:MAG: hypothetical protein VCD00_07685 [Candidatus Hydrogenedentota bacterium]
MKGRMLFAGMVLTCPLQAYAYVPYLDVSFGAVLLSGILLLWIWQWRRLPIRTPLEYWWPMLAAGVAVIWSRGEWNVVAPLIAFIVAVQYVRGRSQLEHLMLLVVICAGATAALNYYASRFDMEATSYALTGDVTFVGSYLVSDGFFLLALGIIWGVYITLGSTLAPELRTASFFSVFLCLGVLGGKFFLLRNSTYDWSGSLVETSSFLLMIAVALTLLLVARITAKLWVTPKQSIALPAVLTCSLIGGFVYWCLVPGALDVYHGVLLGLVAGYALPDGDASSEESFPTVPALVCAGLIVANMLAAFPDNERDGRNIDYVAQSDWNHNRFDAVHERAVRLVEVYPRREASIYEWMARASIKLNALDRASKELALAGRSISEMETDPVLEKRLDLTLSKLRVAVTALSTPEETFAYERALVGLGERGSALVLLRMKVESGLVNLPESWSREVRAFVYAALLGDMEYEKEIAQWDVLDRRVGDGLWIGMQIVSKAEEDSDGSMATMLDRWPDGTWVYRVTREARWVETVYDGVEEAPYRPNLVIVAEP